MIRIEPSFIIIFDDKHYTRLTKIALENVLNGSLIKINFQNLYGDGFKVTDQDIQDLKDEIMKQNLLSIKS